MGSTIGEKTVLTARSCFSPVYLRYEYENKFDFILVPFALSLVVNYENKSKSDQTTKNDDDFYFQNESVNDETKMFLGQTI